MNIINVYCPAWYHFQTSAGQRACPMFVMTQDAIGELACYAGVADLPDPSKEHYQTARELAAASVAANGTKMNLKQASAFFSGLTKENYRA